MIIAENTFKMGYICGALNWGSGLPGVLATGRPLLRDDVPVAGAAGASIAKQRAFRRVIGANVDSNSVAYADIANLTVTISRLEQLAFEYWLLYATSAAAEGIGVQLAYTGTAAVVYDVEAYTDPSTRAPLVVATAFGSGLAPYSVGPGAAALCTIRIKGSFNPSALGDLSVQLRAETGGANTVTVFTSSWCSVSAIS